MENVLETIAFYRDARKWSNYDLAIHAGIKPTTISAWYRRDIVPTLPTLVKVCDAFQITLTEFSQWLSLASESRSYLRRIRLKCLNNGRPFDLNSRMPSDTC